MEFNANKPIFKQIADLCIARVISGEWEPGRRIPSAREMAVTVAVNLHTVLKAYEELESRGIIISRRGMGFFVADGARETALGERRREFLDTTLTEVFDEMKRLDISPDEVMDAYKRYLSND